MRRSRRISLALGILLVGLAQLWIITAGGKEWSPYSFYYKLQTEAFLHGQLSLRVKPSAALLALPNPYDPVANRGIRLHDAVLFGGKYYLYWGPAPAMLAAAICWPLGITHPTFGDEYVTFISIFGASALGMVLIWQIRQTAFVDAPRSITLAAVTALALSGPITFVLATPSIYEAAIAAGQLFLMMGIVAAWFAMTLGKWVLWSLAGIGWVLACASRVSLPPAIIVMTAVSLIWIARQKRRAMLASALTVPLVAGAAAMASYNYARFGSVTEFGIKYQLTGADQTHMALWSIGRVAENGLVYLMMPPYRVGHFPFLLATGWEDSVRRLLHLPSDYGFQPSIGIAWTAPFLFFAIAATWKWRTWKLHSPLVYLALLLAAGGLLGFAVTLGIDGSTMRYQLDAVPCISVLAAMGCWTVWRNAGAARKWILNVGCGAMTVLQLVMGFVLGLEGYSHHFAESNPGLLAAMSGAVRWLVGR